MKIPFDIKYRPQIESGEYKVETRDGRPVRVLCWDRVAKVNQPKGLRLCVLVQEDGEESVYYYYSDGTKWVTNYAYDLFIVTPEKELSEFEKRLFEIRHIAKRDMYSEQEWQTLRNESAELLSLAREELFANDTVLKEYAEKARKQGETEALKKFETQCKISSDIEHGLAYRLGFKAGRADALIDEISKIPSFKED